MTHIISGILNIQVYIYQRWIYRVDPKRVNEYGVSMENPEGEEPLEEERRQLALKGDTSATTVSGDSQKATLESKKDQ